LDAVAYDASNLPMTPSLAALTPRTRALTVGQILLARALVSDALGEFETDFSPLSHRALTQAATPRPHAHPSPKTALSCRHRRDAHDAAAPAAGALRRAAPSDAGRPAAGLSLVAAAQSARAASDGGPAPATVAKPPPLRTASPPPPPSWPEAMVRSPHTPTAAAASHPPKAPPAPSPNSARKVRPWTHAQLLAPLLAGALLTFFFVRAFKNVFGNSLVVVSVVAAPTRR
jgi:hypothetical protein